MSERIILNGIIRGFAEKALQEKPDRQNAPEIRWLAPTTAAIANLPWFEENLPDGRTPPQPFAAAELL